MRYLSEIEVPAELENEILTKVARLIRRRVLAFRFLAAGSFASLIYSLTIAGQSFWQSGFYQYLQLLWTDQSAIAAYWREFGWSLLESLPTLSLVAVLSVAGLFFWSLLKVRENNFYGFKKMA